MAANPLLNPGQPLSGNALLAAAKGLANAQTSPVIAALAQQIAQNQAQTRGAESLTSGYFGQLGNQAQQGVTAQQGIASGLNSTLQGIGQDEQSQLQGIGQNATQSLLKYTPQSDAAHSLAQPAVQGLAAEIAREQGLAAQNQGAFRSFGASQGANYGNLAASNLGTFALKGEEALGNIAQAGQLRNAPLSAKIANEHAMYGADLATALGKLRQQEIVNRISEAGLGIKQQSASAAQANAAAHTTAANAGAARSAFDVNPGARGSPAWKAVQDANNKAWEANPGAVGSLAWSRAHKATGAGGALKPLTTNQNSQWFAHLGNVAALIGTMQRGGYKNSKGIAQPAQSKAAISNALSTKYDPLMVQAAFELLNFGGLMPGTAAAMNRNGLRGGQFNGQPIKVKNVSVGRAISSAAG